MRWIVLLRTGASDDSLHAGLDGQAISSCDKISNFASNSQWLWTSTTMDSSSRSTFNVSSTGVHTVNIWMREDGFRIDKIVLTTNQSYTPTGTGPAESPPAINDTDEPEPDPMTWYVEPYATGSSSISMTATTATDISGVEYYFECTSGGGNDSDWQDSVSYTDTGLNPDTPRLVNNLVYQKNQKVEIFIFFCDANL